MRTRLRDIAWGYFVDADSAHGMDHTERVVRLALELTDKVTGARVEIVEAAAWLHDIGRGHEDGKGRSHAEVSAEIAAGLLPELGYCADDARLICRAIADHRYSAGRVPESIEGCILQDADRLDALGAIGIARTFAHGASRQLYHADDPFGEHRDLDDDAYSLDHFFMKLFRLPATLHTEYARELAECRVEYMRGFIRQMAAEIGNNGFGGRNIDV